MLHSDPRSVGEIRGLIKRDPTLRMLQRQSGLDELNAELSDAIVNDDFNRASVISEEIYSIFSSEPGSHPTALLNAGTTAIDLHLAAQDLDGATAFGKQLVDRIRSAIETHDDRGQDNAWRSAAKHQLQTAKLLKSRADKNDPLVGRYCRLVKRRMIDEAKVELDMMDSDGASVTEDLMDATIDLVGADQLNSIDLMLTVGIQAVDREEDDFAAEIIQRLQDLESKRYGDVVEGNRLFLEAYLAEALGNFDDAIASYQGAAEAFQPKWPADAAGAYSAASLLSHEIEDYESAAESTRNAFDHFMAVQAFDNALIELPWLISSYQLLGSFELAESVIDRGIEFCVALNDPASLRDVLLEAAWTYESAGDEARMLAAYDDVIESAEDEDAPHGLTSTMQYRADSLDLLIDNAGAFETLDQLVGIYAKQGEHEAAADTAIEAAKRWRSMHGQDAQLAALRRYKDRMGDANSIRIVIDQIAGLQAGMDSRFLTMRKLSREAAKEIAAGEDADVVMAEVQAVQDMLPTQEQHMNNAEESFAWAAELAQQQCFGSAAEAFFDSAVSLNDASHSPAQLSATLANYAKALSRSHQFEDAARGYRIAADHLDQSSVDHWQAKRSEMIQRLACHQLAQAKELAESLLQRQGIRDQLESNLPLLARACELQIRWTLADIEWLRGNHADAEASSRACLTMLGEVMDELDPSQVSGSDRATLAKLAFVNSLLRSEYVDVRDYLHLGAIPSEELSAKFPARAVLTATREAWLAEVISAADLLKTMTAAVGGDADIRDQASRCLDWLNKRSYTRSNEDQRSEDADDLLARAERVRMEAQSGSMDLSEVSELAEDALEQWRELPDEERPFLSMMHAELLISESLVHGNELNDPDQVDRGLWYLDQAEARLAATGMRPADVARCGALRFLLEAAGSFDPICLNDFDVALEFINDYLQLLFPNKDGQFRLAAQTGTSMVTDMLDKANMDFRSARPTDPRLDWMSPLMLLSQHGDDIHRGFVEVSGFINEPAHAQLARAIALAILQRTAAGQLDLELTAAQPRYDALPQYQLRLDVIASMLRADSVWTGRALNAPPFPDRAFVWFEGSDPQGEPSLMSVSTQLSFASSFAYGVSPDLQAWHQLRESLLEWLPIENAANRLEKLDQSIRVPKPQASEPNPMPRATFSPSARQTTIDAAMAILGLELPEIEHDAENRFAWIEDLAEALLSPMNDQ